MQHPEAVQQENTRGRDQDTVPLTPRGVTQLVHGQHRVLLDHEDEPDRRSQRRAAASKSS